MHQQKTPARLKKAAKIDPRRAAPPARRQARENKRAAVNA